MKLLGRAREYLDHVIKGSDDEDDVDQDTGERLSVWDAAHIWLSNGMDEDYTFGFGDGL